MDDLIRKQTVLNMIDDVQFGNITHKLSQLHEAVRNYPSVDAVEVVRCKDCKHKHRTEYAYDGMVVLSCTKTYDFNGFDAEVEPNHFCSYGERKETYG